MEEIYRSGPTAVAVNGIRLVYESFGDEDAPAMLLIAGQGNHMLSWAAPFCTLIAKRGLRVIRFDNRDAGLSTKFTGNPFRNPLHVLASYVRKKPVGLSYTLMDMTKDAVGLLDALHIARAHVVGKSLGGMLAQMMAIHYPDRLLTMTLLMSSTGEFGLPLPRPKMLKLLRPPRYTDRAGYIEHIVKVQRLLHGSGYEFDEESLREYAAAAYERDHGLDGAIRQLSAVIASPGRGKQLRRISTPTLVIHGSEDPLLPVEHGIHAAKIIPNAELLILDGVGHELPPPLWPLVAEVIAEHALRRSPDAGGGQSTPGRMK